MMHLPDYIDNSQHTLENVLKQLIETHQERNLDIATGYFYIDAWTRLEDAFNQLDRLRLLIGEAPAIAPAERSTLDLTRFLRQQILGQLDHEPFNSHYKQKIDRLIAYLEQDHIQVRLYGAQGKSQFLHAKAYIFDHNCIVGSSNFTPSGLAGNTELNVLIKNRGTAQDLRHNWFAKFWDDESVDTDYKAKLIDTLNASKFGSKPYTPYQVFVKTLYEFFKDDLGLSGSSDSTTLELASFQQEGFERAVRLIEQHNAAMVADAVGLGKTFIGLRLLEHYLQKDRRPGYVPRALVICPAQLRDLVWHKKLDEFGVKATIVSQEELGRKTFDTRFYNRYDIVVVDESHNFRNPGTNRYQNLQRLLGSGKRNQRVVLLTATPINTNVFDLYHQMLLLTRNSNTYYRDWGISNLRSYFSDLSKGKVEITELLLQTMVRRSRQDVKKRQEAGEQLIIAGKEIRFPKRQLEQFTYSFEGSFRGLYAGIAQQIDQLNLAPYNIRSFKRKQNKDDQTQIKKNAALVALMKSMWLKRLESSIVAFGNSITTQRKFQSEFEGCLHQGKLLDSKSFRKLIAFESDEEESIGISELIASLVPVDPKEYDIKQLEAQIAADFHILEDILGKLDRIRATAAQGTDPDLKLVAFKQQLLQLKGQKILVFSYFKDTAEYVTQQLLNDRDWLSAMQVEGRSPTIELITGATPGRLREETVRRFAPKSNAQTEEDFAHAEAQPIDLLICTDVLSEGQNLQDAGVLINYDLHWNPVRMIQRAGRIDRLGTEFEELFIYNCFPEEGLEELLGLVARLQQRIATIDREVGLDASVLGELVSERSLEELRRLKEAETDAEKAGILAELEQVADLVSLDEMRFPLLEFMQQMGREAAEEIPMGIHSIRSDGTLDGVFLAFRVRDRHFWHFYPRINGHISTDPKNLVSEKRKIFQRLQCQASDYSPPETLPPVQFDTAIFAILGAATRNLLEDFKKQQSGVRLRPTLPKLLLKIQMALTQQELAIDEATKEAIAPILRVIASAPLRSYEGDIKQLWEAFVASQDVAALVAELDDLFVDQALYHEAEEEKESDLLEAVREEEVQLVCYQWFRPK